MFSLIIIIIVIMPGGLTHLSLRLERKRLQFVSHCYQADKEIISSLILLRSAGTVHSHKVTYPEVTARDSGFDTRDLSIAMANCGVWEEISMNVLSRPLRLSKDDDDDDECL